MASGRLQAAFNASTKFVLSRPLFYRNLGALQAGFCTSSNKTAAIKNVTVFGGGLMGGGIAQVFTSY
jgi:hypothetical protein